MVYTYEYDEEYAFGPALPIVEVKVLSVDDKHSSNTFYALVDSGADATIIPVTILNAIGANRVGRAQMRWGSHRSHTYDVYLITLQIGPFQVRGVRVLADNSSEEIILGRDALNHLVVTLNGLANVVEISQ